MENKSKTDKLNNISLLDILDESKIKALIIFAA